jgi:hypothetical protein
MIRLTLEGATMADVVRQATELRGLFADRVDFGRPTPGPRAPLWILHGYILTPGELADAHETGQWPLPYTEYVAET